MLKGSSLSICVAFSLLECREEIKCHQEIIAVSQYAHEDNFSIFLIFSSISDIYPVPDPY